MHYPVHKTCSVHFYTQRELLTPVTMNNHSEQQRLNKISVTKLANFESRFTYRDSPARNQEESPLLRLPAEQRNKIYVLAFDTLQIYTVSPDHFKYPKTRLVETGTSLLLAYRQTHQEAAPFKGSYPHLDFRAARVGLYSLPSAKRKGVKSTPFEGTTHHN